jgi:serine protease Do
LRYNQVQGWKVRAMVDEDHGFLLSGTIALEHLTGPSRGTVTWLNGATLDVSLSANRLLRVTEAGAEDPAEYPVARLRRADGSYEIDAADGCAVWVNGNRVISQKLGHRDMIEFGDAGPLSRFCLYREDWPVRKMVTDILGDGLVYLRVSRKPLAIRLSKAVYSLFQRLMQETTLLFRFGVIIAILVLGGLSYQQLRLNILLQDRIDSGASRLESFASALTRARDEALVPSDLEALQDELSYRLSSNADRLAQLERRTQANARVIANSMSSVVFLQGSYGFRESSTGSLMRYAVDDNGQPLLTPLGQPMLTLAGDGPVAERHFTGTAFAVGSAGALVTNRHVALPWEGDADVKAMARRGLEPVMIKSIVYAPGTEQAYAVQVISVSEDADLAVLRLVDATWGVSGLGLADDAPVPGNEVIVMGYPTGLRSMLAQSGEEFIEELKKIDDIGFWTVAARLAEDGYIAPLASRGIVSQVTSATVVYDADTTHGGSGGPVLDIDGKVVAVNAAILPEYGGSNLGIPVAKLRALLTSAGM